MKNRRMPSLLRLIPALLLAIPLPSTASAADKPAAKKITYNDDIKPIFREKCFACHNPDKKSSGLNLTNYTALMEGGSSGEVIEVGSAEDSYLVMLINHEDEPNMPPNSDMIPEAMRKLIGAWIDGGALESASSKAAKSTKPKLNLKMDVSSTDRPEHPAMPEGIPCQPVTKTVRTTAVTALATSPWAPLVAVAGQKEVLLYHTESLKLLGILPFEEGVAYTLAFSRNGSLLLAGGGRGAAAGKTVVWDVKTGKRVMEVGDEWDAVLAADIMPDQSLVALGSPLRVVRVFNTADGQPAYDFRKHTDWITSVAFSPDGVLLATGDRNGGLFVLEAETGHQYLELKGHTKSITSLSWRIDSNILASCSEDGSIRLWEMENGRQVKTWKAHGAGVSSIEFARNGQLVSCGRDKLATLWDQNGKKIRSFPAFADLALKVTYCDETNRVIAGDWTGTVRVWNAVDGKPVGELSTNPDSASTTDNVAAR